MITLLSFITGILSVSISSVVQKQRFQTDASIVLDKLRLAQDLMLLTNADVTVTLTSQENGTSLDFKIDSPLTKEFRNYLEKNSKLSIDSIAFDTQKSPITLEFLSGGSLMSQGVLTLSSSSNKRFICLKGFPHPIVFTDEKACSLSTDPFFEARLTEITRQQIEN